jgi:hypothetical protein
MREPEYYWDEETGVAGCILTDSNDKTYTGTAFCAEEDQDMKSEKTGCTIAAYRAEIDYYKSMRDNEIKPGLKALRQLYYSINTSKNFDEKSYCARMLKRQIRQYETDLAVVNDLLASAKQDLKTFLADKEKAYSSFRRMRKNKAQADNN